MLPHKCVLPLLTAYLMLKEVSASDPSHRNKRDASLLDHELHQHLVDNSDLSVGDVGDTGKELHGRASHSLTLHDPPGRQSLPQQREHQLFHKTNEHKIRKVAPLDSLSSFWRSTVRNRKDEHMTH